MVSAEAEALPVAVAQEENFKFEIRSSKFEIKGLRRYYKASQRLSLLRNDSFVGGGTTEGGRWYIPLPFPLFFTKSEAKLNYALRIMNYEL